MSPRRRYQAPPPREQYALFDTTVQLRQPRSMQDLPETAHDLIEIIGLHATIDLVRVIGGDELKVPVTVDGDSHAWHMLVDIIGRDAAIKLVNSRFGGTPIYVPMCTAALRAERNRDILRRVEAGEKRNAVRRIYPMSKANFYRLLQSMTRED